MSLLSRVTETRLGALDPERCTNVVLAAFDLPVSRCGSLNAHGLLSDLRRAGWKWQPLHWDRYGQTLAKFVRAHPKGKFVLGTRQHALGLLNGKLVDAEGKGANRRRVNLAYEVWKTAPVVPQEHMGYVGEAAPPSLLSRVLAEELSPEDQKLADDIVDRRDPDDEMWREVRHRLHGHPAGVPGVERDGVVEAVPPSGAACEKCRRAGRGTVSATTMRKGAWGVWSYLCQACADGKKNLILPEAKQTTADLVLAALAELSGDTIDATDLAKRIGRSKHTVIKVAGKLAARGKIHRLPSLDVYRAKKVSEEREVNVTEGTFTFAEVRARARQEMARTGLSAEELLLRAARAAEERFRAREKANSTRRKKGGKENMIITTEESTTFKLEWPDTAEDDKAFVLLWADGRGICAFRHKKDAKAFASKKSNDVVWVHYESPVRKMGRTGHRKNVRLRVANSYEPKQEDRLDGSNMHASGAGTLHQRIVLNRDGNPTISAETETALGEFLPEEREVNADGTFSCGVFLPVPYNLARSFPDKGEHDSSVPHYTLLFAGDLSVADYQKLVEVVQTVARAYEPFTLTMAGYHEFTNNDGQTIPHMGALQNLGRLHAALRVAAEVEDIPIAHSYGPEEDSRPYADQFKTHATLDYIDKGKPAYSGPKPTGSWRVTELEVWGHGKYRILLGRTKADQPAEEPVTALEHAMEVLELTEAKKPTAPKRLSPGRRPLKTLREE